MAKLINKNDREEILDTEEIIEDDFVYSRNKRDNANTNILINKLKAGIVLDPITLQRVSNYPIGDGTEDKEAEDWVVIVINGGHRIEAVEKFNVLAEDEENDFEEATLAFEYYRNDVLDYESNRSSLLIASHRGNDSSGMPSRSQDTKKSARNLKKDNPEWTQKEIGEALDRDRTTIQPYIKDILDKEKATRQQQAMRLSQLGWTQKAIGKVIGRSQNRVSEIIDNVDANNIDNLYESGKSPEKIAEYADYEDLDIQTVWSIVLEDKSDSEKIEELTKARIRENRSEENRNEPVTEDDLKNARFIKNHHNWYFNDCWSLMGQNYPGQIPGQIVLNVLYRFTEQGDRVIDPMAGGGVTPDACLLMNRKCQAYDIRPSRYDIIEHDVTQGFPEDASKADLIFLDPPYYLKKAEEYQLPEELRTRDGFLGFAESWVKFCQEGLKPDGFVALLMGSWFDYEDKAKSIYSWDYLPLFTDFVVYSHYQVPISTQHFTPSQESLTNEWNAKRDRGGHLLNNGRTLYILERQNK